MGSPENKPEAAEAAGQVVAKFGGNAEEAHDSRPYIIANQSKLFIQRLGEELGVCCLTEVECTAETGETLRLRGTLHVTLQFKFASLLVTQTPPAYR